MFLQSITIRVLTALNQVATNCSPSSLSLSLLSSLTSLILSVDQITNCSHMVRFERMKSKDNLYNFSDCKNSNEKKRDTKTLYLTMKWLQLDTNFSNCSLESKRRRWMQRRRYESLRKRRKRGVKMYYLDS